MNGNQNVKKYRTRTLDWKRYDIPLDNNKTITTANVPALTNTGDIATDYNNIKAIKSPDKATLKAPPQTVYVEHDPRPRVIT